MRRNAEMRWYEQRQDEDVRVERGAIRARWFELWQGRQ